MNAASQLPSGVFTVTSDSTTSSVAANDWPVAATSPAATERAINSRRETFAPSAFVGSCLPAAIVPLRYSRWRIILIARGVRGDFRAHDLLRSLQSGTP